MTVEVRDDALRAAVAARRPLVQEVMTFIHGHPELAHDEHESAAHLARVLGELGLTVETGMAGMATAFRATLRGGLPGRTVGLVANYDAVPSVPASGVLEAIHACGHGPIAAGVVVETNNPGWAALGIHVAIQHVIEGQQDRIAGI